MLADPAATPVTRPLALTVATAAFSLDQANVAPGIVAPLASAAVAANCCVAPTAIEAPLGAMVTDATTGGGGGAPLSLQLPNVLVAAAAHDPSD
jgi:hypothetical protein